MEFLNLVFICVFLFFKTGNDWCLMHPEPNFNSTLRVLVKINNMNYRCTLIKLHLKNFNNFKRWQGIIVEYKNFTFSYLGMEVDEGCARGTTALAAARAYAEGVGRREMQPQQPAIVSTISTNTEQKVKNSVNTGISGLFKQCSNAKLADRTANVYTVSNECGYMAEKVPVPRIGSMAIESEADIANLFHGARQMRGNVIRNDVITSTFDPATLNCNTSSGPHEIMSGTGPSAIILSDQDFVPALSHETDTGCIAIVRLEDASLHDLEDLAPEIFEKKNCRYRKRLPSWQRFASHQGRCCGLCR
jgi:hypothetical protein